MRLLKLLLPCLFVLASLSATCCAEDDTGDEPSPKAFEYPSPDGRYAFRHIPATEEKAKAYVLIEKASGKVLQQVAEAELDPSPSDRFSMTVLWRPDSKAFALTALFWKRGSTLLVFRRQGALFRQLDLPELAAEITDKAAAGRRFPHVAELHSQSAKRWQKDGSLVAEIETMQDGEGAMITALRTVTLGFGKSDKARILKSTIKFTTEQQ